MISILTGALNIAAVTNPVVRGSDPNDVIVPFAALDCEVSDIQGTPSFRWRHDGNIFVEENNTMKYIVLFINTTSFLTELIIRADYSDGGVYVCEAMDSNSGWVSASVNFTLISE